MRNSIQILIVFLVILSLGFLPYGCQNTDEKSMQKAVPDIVDYNFHVKPILSDRCFTCHGPDENTREGDLRFDTEEGMFAALGKEKDHFAIVPGDIVKSTLVDRMYTENPDDMMPPPESNLTLEAYEKEILKKWIEQGAKWKKHWSFLPIEKPDIPTVQNEDWIQNDIDNFVLSQLEKEGITPAEKASKRALLRRVSFDLTGLPPTLVELQDFENDNSANAYEKAIDRLLDSDAWAENMASKWMDLARYADTHGYQDDLERTMWPWRDWVIHAFQKNMPYNEFVKWQLGGDLIPNRSKEQLIASAFNRNHKITQEGGVIPEEYRVEYVSDRTQTFGTAFLGLTFECAKCHDHKYDPISQKDYYSLFSFFNNVPEFGLIQPYGAIPKPYITLTKEEIDETLTFINNLDTMEAIPLMVMEEMDTIRQAYILNRGAYDKPTDSVTAETPSSILKYNEEFPKNRLGLADWLFHEDNPLTARVTVNRLWQQCFGNGIVATSYDFGNQGSLPTHPELLDFLAAKLRDEGWDQKAILKYIVLSSTYQQSAKVTADLLERDPENQLLARAPRLRLTAEMIRDHALAVSGLLNKTVGGPSVKPYQPNGLWQETTGGGGGSTSRYVQDDGSKLYRRSMYTFWKRTVPPPSMMTFDAASRDFCMVQRETTSTPLQALIMLNDPQIVESARVLAYRAIENAEDLEHRISMMFEWATSREPSAEELTNLKSYFEEEFTRFQKEPKEAESFLAIGEYEQKALLDTTEMAAYAIVANVIFNLDETITRG
ncbi:MAG: PSD1 and planctomycete cytochrome C domain-containing protein [Bacteroidetes bacterium]|jgi:hypothetical protein|nr:PSD1 and planctomycete cytochrome C domain-containing protein [Bacteroidota bacterium]